MLLTWLLACATEAPHEIDVDADGFTEGQGDCDDVDAAVFPGAPERCDGADDDCDGQVDEADAVDAVPWYADADGDGFGDGEAVTVACAAEGVAVAGDCDDGDATAWPGAPELCDEVDADCDGDAEEGEDAATWFVDGDADGHGDPDQAWVSCERPEGYSADDLDCDDADASVHEGAVEVCDGRDDDCDGERDEADAADAPTWYLDGDGDTFGDAAVTLRACDAPEGFVADATDCADDDEERFPGATETCDGDDEDCDAEADEADAADAPTWYADADGDGYGDPADAATACERPADRVANARDCDDTDAGVNPGVATWTDADGDGWGTGVATDLCTADGARVDGDCDDGAAAVRPDATETCDGTDSNCSGDESDALDPATWYADADGDGYGDASVTALGCDAPVGFAAVAEDCDDTDGAVNPGVAEVCDNGVDDDCDGGAPSCGLQGTFDPGDAHATLTPASGTLLAVAAGDLDGDGVADLVLASQGGAEATAAEVWFGPVAAGASYDLAGSWSGEGGLGAAAAIGDVTGDGVDDLLLGAPEDDELATDGGGARLFAGGFTDLDAATAHAHLAGTTPGGWLGQAVAIGDYDGDGVGDVVLGADCASAAPAEPAVFFGPVAGSLSTASADVSFTRPLGSPTFGAGVALLDGDGDGYGDLVVSDHTNDTLHVYRGPTTGSVASATDRWVGGAALGSSLGYAVPRNNVRRAADFDGDGFDDLLAGATDGAYLLSGAVSGATAVTGATLVFPNTASYSTAVDAVADVDDDGGPDVLVGSTTTSAYLFYDPAAGTLALADADATLLGGADGLTAELTGDAYADVLLFPSGGTAAWLFSGGGE